MKYCKLRTLQNATVKCFVLHRNEWMGMVFLSQMFFNPRDPRGFQKHSLLLADVADGCQMLAGQKRSLLTTLWPSCRRSWQGPKGPKPEKMKLGRPGETWGDLGRHGTQGKGRVGDVLLYPLPTRSANGESLKNENRKRHCYSNRKMALEGDSKNLKVF